MTSYGRSPDSTALAPLPAQDRMCPFGIIGVAARYSPTGPLGKVALRPARLHLAAHGYIERNTGRGAVLPPSKLTRDLAPGPFPDGIRPPTSPQGDKDVHNTVRLRVSIFPFATQGGRQVSFYFRQGNWVQAREAQIRFPAG